MRQSIVGHLYLQRFFFLFFFSGIATQAALALSSLTLRRYGEISHQKSLAILMIFEMLDCGDILQGDIYRDLVASFSHADIVVHNHGLSPVILESCQTDQRSIQREQLFLNSDAALLQPMIISLQKPVGDHDGLGHPRTPVVGAASRVAFPKGVLLRVRCSGKPRNKDNRPEAVAAMRKIHRDDIKHRRACDGRSPALELDKFIDAGGGIVTRYLTHGLHLPCRNRPVPAVCLAGSLTGTDDPLLGLSALLDLDHSLPLRV
jgi:hypothetical protein